MPQRLLDLPPMFIHTIEAVLLGALLGWNGFWYHASLISDADWNKLTGPHGVAFLAVCAVIVLWANKVLTDRHRAKDLAIQDQKEDIRREIEERNKEKRHAESLAASRDYADSIKALAVESMKVSMRVDQTLSKLVDQLKARPCQSATQKPSEES